MLAITVVAARRLNPDPFAILAFAMATGWLLGVATDAGLSMYLARETARGGVSEPRRGRQFVLEIVGLRAGLAFVAVTIVLFVTPSLVPRHWRMQFVLVVAAQLCGAVLETIAHYFRGLQRSEIESAIHAAYRLTMLVLALVVLWWWRRLDYLAIAMLVPGVIAIVRLADGRDALVHPAKAGHHHRDSGRTAVGSAFRRIDGAQFFRDIFPLGAAVLISALYFRIDVYFIQQWHGFQPVGGYNAAFRLVEALRLLPAAVMAVTFPLLVQSARHRSGAQHRRQAGDRRRRARRRVRGRRTRDRSGGLRRALRIRRAGVCGALARAAAVLPQLRAHPPGDRVGRSPRLPSASSRWRSSVTSPPTSSWCRSRHRRRGDRNGPHRNHRDGRLCLWRCAARFRDREVGTRLQHEGSPT